MTNLIHTDNLALLIFSRSAKAEAIFKVIAPTSLSNKAASEFLHSKVVSLAKATSLPHYFIDETKQEGLTFGNKFANAFDQLFAKGYKYVIAIGNDCPSLTFLDIKNAAASLKESGSVVGPTKKNGAYLIGMNIAAFDIKRFAQLSWQSKDTLSSLTQYFDSFQVSRCHILSIKNDINGIMDWQAVLPALEKKLKQIIFSILNIGKSILVLIVDSICILTKYITPALLRGPPAPFITL